MTHACVVNELFLTEACASVVGASGVAVADRCTLQARLRNGCCHMVAQFCCSFRGCLANGKQFRKTRVAAEGKHRGCITNDENDYRRNVSSLLEQLGKCRCLISSYGGHSRTTGNSWLLLLNRRLPPVPGDDRVNVANWQHY